MSAAGLTKRFGYFASQVSHQQSAFANAHAHTTCAARTSSTRARVQAYQSKRTRARVHAHHIGVRRPYHKVTLISTVAAEPRGFFPRLFSVTRGVPIFSLFPLAPSIPCSARARAHPLTPRARSIGLSSPVCPGYAVHSRHECSGTAFSVAFVLVGGSFWAELCRNGFVFGRSRLSLSHTGVERRAEWLAALEG